VAVQRAYADWRRYPQYIVSLSEASIDLIFAPAYGSSRKNATDIRLAIDALELVFTRPEIGTFILLSGDSDFSSLVLKLKEYGKYVIGVGLQESTSDILVQNCDEYYSYNTLGGLTAASEMSSERLDPWELVVKAIERMEQRKDVMRSDRLKQVMLEIDSSFDEKAAGFTKFNRFLAEAAHRDLIRLRKGESGQYEVAPGTDSPAEESTSASEPAARTARSRGGRKPRSKPAASPRRTEEPASSPEPKRALASEAPADALEHAYSELTAVVAQLFDGTEPVRDSMVKRRLLERESSFDEGALGFRKFSEFLKQADEDGVVDLNQGEDGNFYLKPGKPGQRKTRSGGGRGGRGRGRGTGSPAAGRQEEAAAPPSGEQAEHGGTSAFAAAREAARRTLGRFRGGSHAPAPDRSEAAGEQPRSGPSREGPKMDSAGPGRAAGRSPAEKPRADRSPGRKPQADRGRAREPRKGKPRAGGARSERAGTDTGRTEKPRTETPRGERSRSQRERAAAPRSGRSRGKKPREERRPASEPAAEQTPIEAAPADKSPVDQAPVEAAPGERATVQSGPDARTPDVPETKPAPPKRGMGRYRSGSRGARGPTPSTSGPRIGKVDVGKVEIAEPTVPSVGDGADSGEAPASAPEASAPPTRDTPASGMDGSASPRSRSIGSPVEHMIRNYTGVGRRTAEALVDRFGAEVFQVIDREPGRLTEVISAARARAVVAAREAERSGSGA
jgi:hypothetical protein